MKWLRLIFNRRLREKCGENSFQDPQVAALLAEADPKRISWLLRYHEATWGGMASSVKKIPIDADGSVLPWYTYAAISWIDQLDLSGATVFEFGAGNSSFYWAACARRVVSVESNPDWYEHVKADLKENQKVLLKTDSRGYAEAILAEGEQYQVVIVDGLYRYDCAVAGSTCLRRDGMIVLDNSDWHPKTCAFLRNQGLSQIDFMGPGPINAYAWCTSVFLPPGFAIPRLDQVAPPRVRDGIIQTSEYDKSHI